MPSMWGPRSEERGERRFESVDALVAQISADRDEAEQLLGVVAEETQP